MTAFKWNVFCLSSSPERSGPAATLQPRDSPPYGTVRFNANCSNRLAGLAGWLTGWLTACRWNVKQHILAAASSHRGHQEKVGRSARNVKSVEKRNFRLSQFELHIGQNQMLGLVLITSAEKVPLDFSKVTFLTRISSGHWCCVVASFDVPEYGGAI